MGRCAPWAGGKEARNKERGAPLDAYCAIRQGRWGAAEVLYCVGEGVLNNAVAKTRLAAIGAELFVRAPGQRATAIESRSGLLRMTLHLIEEDMNLSNVSFNFTRL